MSLYLCAAMYNTGGKAVYGLMTNRVAIDKPLTVQSVNGPGVTWIVGAAAPGTTNNGDGAIRCVYKGANAVLSGFTMTNGHTRTFGDYYRENSGGGAWCEGSGVLTNCLLINNSASWYGGGAYNSTLNNCTLTTNSAGYGGGAYDSTLNNCTLTANSADDGGGAGFSTLNNCTLTSNSAHQAGGGAYFGTLNNCIVYYNYNTALTGPNYYGSTFIFSCTTPLPPGTGNIDDEPQLASATHLSTTSPCLGRGSPAYSTGVDILISP